MRALKLIVVGMLGFFLVGNISYGQDQKDVKDVIIIDKDGNVSIGIKKPKTNLHLRGTAKIFGMWQTQEFNRVYLAPTDGIVTAYVFGLDNGASARVLLIGKTDKQEKPTTTRVTTTYQYVPEYGYTQTFGLTMPVRKGHYYQIEALYYKGTNASALSPLTCPGTKAPTSSESTNSCKGMYFIPFGN